MLSKVLNGPECGLSRVPVDWVGFDEKCFKNKYPNKTLFGDFGNTPYLEAESESEREVKPLERLYYGDSTIGRHETPWVVLVHIEYFSRKNNWMFIYCTGTLISFRWVLTAGHCWMDKPDTVTAIIVKTGNDKREWIQEISVPPENFFPNEEFTKLYAMNHTHQNVHDIALIKVEPGFRPNASEDKYLINPICLPNADEYNYDYDYAMMYGFGRVVDTLPLDYYAEPYLQKSMVSLESVWNCPYFMVFCTKFSGKRKQRTCHGDSGGPLVQYERTEEGRRDVLMGVLSAHRPVGPCENATSNEWTQVPRHIDWIINKINAND